MHEKIKIFAHMYICRKNRRNKVGNNVKKLQSSKRKRVPKTKLLTVKDY